jgi:manganese/zinc/iron transport system permease protein
MIDDLSILYLFIGISFISITSGVIGVFNFLQKKALVGDAVAHAVLPGIIIAYLLSGARVSWILLLGAVIAGFLTLSVITLLLNYTKLKQDSVIALVMISFFAFGLSLLSYVQLQPTLSQAGLSDFLFGKVTSLTENDLDLFIFICSLLLIVIRLFFKRIIAIVFDNTFMRFKGYSMVKWTFFLNLITIIIVAIGIQAVGVVLMSALLILPVTTAKQLTNKRFNLMVWTIFFSISSAIIGTFISLNSSQLPTGPLISMVLCCGLFITVSLKWFISKTQANG